MSAQLSPCFSKLRQVGEKGEGENEWGIKDSNVKNKRRKDHSNLREEEVRKKFFFSFFTSD